jgi:hypothetical protein
MRWSGANVIPVIGARTAAQLEDNLGATEVTLSPEHLERLEALSKIELGFPNDFLAILRQTSFGKRYQQISNHRILR